MKKNILFIFIVCATLLCPAGAQNLIPIPSKCVKMAGEPLVWSNVGHIDAPDSLMNEVEHATRIVNERAGVDIATSGGTAVISLVADNSITDREGYTLTLTDGGVTIKGRTAAGIFYGLMTMEQLMIGDGTGATCIETSPVSIEDSPRTHIRELMVDPARMFIPLADLKALVPEMARYKLNSIHLHLVDDQGWRIEIKSYSKLTEEGSTREGMDELKKTLSGYYTQDEMREFVAYAARYHVMVVPEIEMPGHEQAAIHCFPQLTCNSTVVPIRTVTGVSNYLLCPGRENTYTFLGNVFRELADIFPCAYIHLGGDEAGSPSLGCWTDCPDCQALKTRLGISPTTNRSDNWQLQKYLFDRMIDTLRTKYNKIPMFWYETDFKTIQAGCVTFAWRHGLTQAAINAAVSNNAKIMLCPGEHCYFDYPAKSGNMPEVNWGMPVTSLEQAYQLDPSWGMGANFEEKNLFGVAGTLWGECMFTSPRISYMAYPRALALAEAGWSLQANRSFAGFKQRLRPILLDMQRRGIPFYIPNEYIDMQ